MVVRKREMQKGIRLRPDDAALEGAEGEIKVGATSKKIEAHLDGADRAVVTEDQAQTVTNKTIDVDNNTVSNIETDNLKAGVLVTDVSTATLDTELPSALAVKTYVDDSVAGKDEANEIAFNPATSTLVATEVQAAIDETVGRLDTTETNTGTNTTNIGTNTTDIGTNATDIGTNATNHTNHLNDTVDAHDASAISNVPAGNLAATDLQGAVDELQTDVDTRALDSDLTTHIGDTTTHGTTGDIVGTSDTQTLTNKTINSSDIDLGTASNTNKLVVSSDTTANLEALDREAGSVYYSTDDEGYLGDDGTDLVSIGSGGGGESNFYEKGDMDRAKVGDFSTGNNAVFDGGGTLQGVHSISTTEADLLNGKKTSKLVLHVTPATSNNDYVASELIDIPAGYRDRTLRMKMQYKYDGADNDIVMVVKDSTNGTILTDTSEVLTASSRGKEANLAFYCPATCTQVEVGVQVLSHATGSEVLLWDDVVVTPNAFVSKDLVNEMTFSARIQNNGTASIKSQKESAVASVNRTTTGTTVVNFTSGYFTVAPAVTATAEQASNDSTIRITAISNTSCTIVTRDTTSVTLVDLDFNLNIEKQGVDYNPTTEYVVHHDAGVENEFSARIANNGTSTLSSQGHPFIASVNRTGAGTTDVVFNTGFFSVAPAVTVSSEQASNDSTERVTAVSATGCTIVTRDTTLASLIDIDFNIKVGNQGTDYKNPSAYAVTPVSRVAYVEDIKSTGSDGGTFTGVVWSTRDLNTLSGDTSFLSLSANQITLTPGKYIINWRAPAHQVDSHKTRFFDTDNSVTVKLGNATFTSAGNTTSNDSIGMTTLVINEATTYELQHYGQTTKATNGFGYGSDAGDGENETFSAIKIEKVK